MAPTPKYSLKNTSLMDALRLIRSENVGPATFFNVIHHYGSAAKALEMLPELAKRGGRKRPIKRCDINVAEQEIEQTFAIGARFVMYGEEDYPEHMLHIHSPPPVLVMHGSPIWNAHENIGIIGARNASANGCNFAKNIAKELGEASYNTVSGLARGIDTFAHHGSLDSGTIAVIAGGIDTIYPPENKELYHKISELGCLVTEAPFGTTPQARHFPNRNRIIAGISRGLLVVEASKKSGSLITANFALEQGKDVYAVPGSPLDPRCQGTNGLIKDGAILTESAQDIIDNSPKLTASAAAEEPPHFSEPKDRSYESDISSLRELIDEKLSATPISIDALAEQTGIAIATINYILLEKELAGMIERHHGGLVSIVYDAARDAS